MVTVIVTIAGYRRTRGGKGYSDNDPIQNSYNNSRLTSVKGAHSFHEHVLHFMFLFFLI